ncbi:MAG: hypothetical protein KJP21_04360 [Bacteroidia bacterium]|nr:hypothetical protein [Bacteroidia bacterium]NNJ56278.1 hypothetical protein [Bacteroidia bacterium]
MELTLTLVVVIVVAIIALKIASKLVSKFFAILVIAAIALGYMYYKSIGPFKQNVTDISNLKEKYCESNRDEDICDCIIEKAEKDMRKRFNSAEIDSLANQPIRGAYVLKKSLAETKEEALACLAAKGETDKYKVFIQDFIPIENEYLNIVGDKAKQLSQKLKEEYQSFKETKKDIDNKY